LRTSQNPPDYELAGEPDGPMREGAAMGTWFEAFLEAA
jgi:hypothetical protein